jgi:excisionase family DNA binding protein
MEPGTITAAAAPTLLTIREAADFLRLSPRTLRRWAEQRQGPDVIRAGRKLRYRRSALEAFLNQRTEHNEAAQPAA